MASFIDTITKAMSPTQGLVDSFSGQKAEIEQKVGVAVDEAKLAIEAQLILQTALVCFVGINTVIALKTYMQNQKRG